MSSGIDLEDPRPRRDEEDADSGGDVSMLNIFMCLGIGILILGIAYYCFFRPGATFGSSEPFRLTKTRSTPSSNVYLPPDAESKYSPVTVLGGGVGALALVAGIANLRSKTGESASSRKNNAITNQQPPRASSGSDSSAGSSYVDYALTGLYILVPTAFIIGIYRFYSSHKLKSALEKTASKELREKQRADKRELKELNEKISKLKSDKKKKLKAQENKIEVQEKKIQELTANQKLETALQPQDSASANSTDSGGSDELLHDSEEPLHDSEDDEESVQDDEWWRCCWPSAKDGSDIASDPDQSDGSSQADDDQVNDSQTESSEESRAPEESRDQESPKKRKSQFEQQWSCLCGTIGTCALYSFVAALAIGLVACISDYFGIWEWSAKDMLSSLTGELGGDEPELGTLDELSDYESDGIVQWNP